MDAEKLAAKRAKYVGMKLGRLEVIEVPYSIYRARKVGKPITLMECNCKCDCGTIRKYILNHALRGGIKSCGCILREKSSRRNSQKDK
jgi:hypothetical protein